MVASMAEQPHVLVVDDDAKIAAALRRALIYEGYQVEVAPDGQIALNRARERMPDLAILDIMMPGMDGLEVTRRLRAEGDVPILLLTAKDGTADRVRGLDQGADDYLVKPFAYEELLARVRALLRRRAPRARRTLRYADVVMDLATREVRRADQLIATTAKEFDLLQHFMRNPGQVLRREQLLDAVWGFDFGASSNVVDVYVGYLRQKLEQGGRPRLLQTVRGVGYILKEERTPVSAIERRSPNAGPFSDDHPAGYRAGSTRELGRVGKFPFAGASRSSARALSRWPL
jgi:two-component system response regulator MprA